MDAQNGLPTPEEMNDALQSEEDSLAGLTPEERAVAAKILPALAAKANAAAEANKARELKRAVDDLTAHSKKILEAKVEEWRKAMTPPTEQEIQSLLNQEYGEFTVSVTNKTGERKKYDFVIRELPMALETRIVTAIRRTLSDRLIEISRVEWSSGSSVIANVEMLASVVPGVLETLAECCAICLDADNTEINGEWVMTNIGSSRMLAILQAQVTASRYRDFLSLLSRIMQLAPAT